MTIILIGGTSHTGKSTLAARLGDRLGIDVMSTDKLGRHPGRPWPVARPEVAEFYRSLSPETIHWFLKVHHENMRPRLGSLIETAPAAGFVLEGSALRPEYMAGWNATARVFLHADPAFLTDRIRISSQYDTLSTEARALVDVFTERSLRENAEGLEAARRHDITLIDAADGDTMARLAESLASDHRRLADEPAKD